jgi:hypothetical protein
MRFNRLTKSFIVVSLCSLLFLNGCEAFGGNIKLNESESQAVSRVKSFDLPVPEDVNVESRYYVDDYGWFMEGFVYYVFSFASMPSELLNCLIIPFNESFVDHWNVCLDLFGYSASQKIEQKDLPVLKEGIKCLRCVRYKRQIRQTSEASISEEYMVAQILDESQTSESQLTEEWQKSDELLLIFSVETEKLYSFVILY